jgi:tRNA nucleotidyltransferase (CCA-adding enzyme)
VLGTLFPELESMIGFDQGSRYHDMTTDEHTFTALETAAKVEAPLRVRWALLFHDAGKVKAAWIGPDGRKHYYASKVFDLDNGGEQRTTEDHEVISERLWRTAAKRMNVPTRLREDVATLVRNHMVAVSGKIKSSKVRRERVRLGDELLRDLHMHRMCDLSGKTRAHRGHLVHVARLEDVRRQAQALGVPASVKDLKVTGKDAIALGMTGRWIGGALDVLLDEVVVQPDDLRLSREWQLSRLEHMANHRKDLDAIIECR